MQRYTITLGASTTAGGKVISASSMGSINGIQIALENDIIFCPACKSKGKILCVGPRIEETWNGMQVALENDLCLCGCFPSPRLIANQSLRSQVTDAGEASSADGAGQSLASDTCKSPGTGYDLDFQLIEVKGTPAADWPYNIELAGGQRIEGRTDNNGKTSKIAATFAEDAILRVYMPEPTPIDPNWDR